MKRAFAAALVTFAAVTTSAVAATPASAAQGTRPCPSDFYCFYEHANYGGWHLNYQTTKGGDFNNPPGSSGNRRDQVSSVINNGNRTICLWNDLTARPDQLLLRVGPYQDFTYVGDSANDKADYWKVNPGNTGC